MIERIVAGEHIVYSYTGKHSPYEVGTTIGELIQGMLKPTTARDILTDVFSELHLLQQRQTRDMETLSCHMKQMRDALGSWCAEDIEEKCGTSTIKSERAFCMGAIHALGLLVSEISAALQNQASGDALNSDKEASHDTG